MYVLQPVTAEGSTTRRAAGGLRHLRRLFGTVREEDLQAWLDGELSVPRRALVRVFLWLRPDEAQRLAAYRAEGEAIARLLSSDPSLRSSLSGLRERTAARAERR